MKEILEAIESNCNSTIEQFEEFDRGFSRARKIIVKLSNGTSWFVKIGADPKTNASLKKEARIYTHLEGKHAPLFGFFIDIPSGSILGLENLSSAEWNIKWTKHCVASVISRLDEVSRLKFPFKIPRLEHLVADFKSWNSIDSAGIEVLGTILGCSDWICDIEAFLRELSGAASFKGHEVVHFDVRIDNLCFRDGRLILIDWDWLSIGNPVLDILSLLPGVYLSGGPHPHDVIKEEYELVSWLAGAWGAQILMHPDGHLSSRLGQLQLRQLKVALDWIARGNGLLLPFEEGTLL